MSFNQLAFNGHAERSGSEQLKACWLASQRIAQQLHPDQPFHGYCGACDEVMPLQVLAPEGGEPDLREGFICPRCHLSARVRIGLGVMAGVVPAHGHVYVTEQSTHAFAWMQGRYPNLHGSEYEPSEERRALLAQGLADMGGHGGIAFEDVTRLSFESGSMDAVLSFDVLEHVPDYRAALREFARVLRKDGTLLATFPFNDMQATLVRASIGAGGEIVHHEAPEYHGDPIGGPVLCFYHFGWDILQSAREAGFASARMAMAWAPEQGVLYGHWMLVATA